MSEEEEEPIKLEMGWVSSNVQPKKPNKKEKKKPKKSAKKVPYGFYKRG